MILDLDDDLPPVPRVQRLRPEADRRERRRAGHTPRRAACAGFRIGGHVVPVTPNTTPGLRGRVVAFSLDGRQAYVRWDGDVGRSEWHRLDALEAC